MKLSIKKSFISLAVCGVLFPNIVLCGDIIVSDDQMIHPNKGSQTTTTVDNIIITNSGALNHYVNGASGAKITVNKDLNLSSSGSGNSYVTVKNKGALNLNNVKLGQQTYVYGNDSNITISGLARLENNGSIESNNSIIDINKTTLNATSYIAGYGDSKVKINDINLSNNSKVYVEKLDINISGDLIAKDKASIYSDNNGTITVSNVTLDNNATLGTKNGTVTISGNSKLDDNSSIFSSGNKTITTNGTLDINGTSNIFGNGDIDINGVTTLDGQSYIDANNSTLTINANTTLDGNSSLYGMDTNGKVTSNADKTITLNNTSRIYTESNDIDLSGDLIAHDFTTIKADNNGSIILNNVTLDNNATIIGKNNNITINGATSFDGNSSIYSTGAGTITLNGINRFSSKNAGIFVENNSSKNISSTVNINLNDKTTLTKGAYIVSQGDGNISINSLNIIDRGFVISDKNINISDLNISDSGDFSYVLVKSKNNDLNITHLTTPSDTNVITYTVSQNDKNVSVYRSFVDASAFGLAGNDASTYNTLLWSMDKNKDKDVYDAINSNLTNSQVATAVKTMTPEISNSSIGIIDISRGIISTIGSHLKVARLNNSSQGISTGDDALDYNAWAQLFTTKLEQDDANGISGFDSTGGGIVLGCDKEVEDNTIYGLALSFGTSKISSKNNLTDASTNIAAKQFTLYFSQSFKNSYLEGYLTKGFNKNNGSRNIILGSFTRVARSSYDSQITSAKLAYGKSIKFDKFTLVPNSSISSSMVSNDKYTETGAQSLNLTVSNKDLRKITGLIGINLLKDIEFKSGSTLAYSLNLSYKKDFGDQYATSSSQFRDADYTFTTNGLPLDDSAIVYGTSFKYTDSSKLVDYKFNIERTESQNARSTIGSITAKIRF